MGGDGRPPRPLRVPWAALRSPDSAQPRPTPLGEGRGRERGGRAANSPTARGRRAQWTRRPPGSAPGAGAAEARALQEPVARGTHTNNNKRKETGRQRSPHRVLHVSGAGRGRGRAAGRAPPGVPPPPRHLPPGRGAPSAHPPSKSEMIPSSCALTAGSDMVAGGRAARRAARGKRPAGELLGRRAARLPLPPRSAELAPSPWAAGSAE